MGAQLGDFGFEGLGSGIGMGFSDVGKTLAVGLFMINFRVVTDTSIIP